MSSKRKSRSVNRRFLNPNEISPTKDGDNGSKSNKWRKESDILGPQWSKEELQRFYEAYRKYGKDWKKVAAAVRNRSMGMVEALYTMNRAYLSLPEGTASVVGLIAIMTDHYSILEGSDSEQESSDGNGLSTKPYKRARGKPQTNTINGSDDALDALQVLADLCLMMPNTPADTGQQRVTPKSSPAKKGVIQSVIRSQVSDSKTSKPGKASDTDSRHVAEVELVGVR